MSKETKKVPVLEAGPAAEMPRLDLTGPQRPNVVVLVR